MHASAIRAHHRPVHLICTQKQLGFELDADDIKVVEKTLRVKYCGQGGLIGPC